MLNNRPRNLTNPQVQQRATMENRGYNLWLLLSVCVLVFAATIIVVRAIQSSVNIQQETTKPFVKKTGCAIFDVDPEINPCDDFYKFACNKWQQQNPRPTWAPEWSIETIMEERVIKTVIEILEYSGIDEDLLVISQAKDLYGKCLMNDGDYNSDDYFIQNLWRSLEGVYGRGFAAGITIPPRKELCGAFVYRTFRFALLHKLLEYSYKDKRELEKIKSEVQSIFNNIKDAFDKENVRSSRKEFRDTKLCAGYPQWIFNTINVQLTLNTKQTYREQMVYIAWSDGDLFDERFQDYDCNLWHMKWEIPRPKQYKELYLQMPSLESPLFVLRRPKAINYGSLGPVISSIMNGSYFDWQSSSSVKCLEKQYGLFTVDFGNEHMSLNGTKTLRSNFVENVALQVAYAAFSRTNLKDNKIPDYQAGSTCKIKARNQFTNDQLFFLGYAQTWCQILSKEELKLDMRLSPRSPNMFNVLGALQNFKEFGKAWDCPVGSSMNPHAGERCQVL